MATLFNRNAQSQVPRKNAKCIHSRSTDRCHALSFSCPQPMITKKPLRLLSEDMTVIVTCGKFVSIVLRFSLLTVYTSDSIRVLSSRMNRTPPLRFKSRFLVRNLRSFDVALQEATGMLMLSYVQAATTTHLCIRCV